MRLSVSSDFSPPDGEIEPSARVLSLRRLNLHDRASSDTNIAHSTLQSGSFIRASKDEYTLGVGDTITVYWDIQDSVGATDWIGLFLQGLFL